MSLARPYAESAERFARDTANHQMTVLHDDGLYRHLRFSSPTNSFCWFELVTWPGTLAFSGDGDGFVFRRVEDMFRFFRDGSKYGINPQYWGEKVADGRDRIRDYSKELFDQLAAEELADAEARWPGVKKAWGKHTDDFLTEYNTEYEDGARRALDEFTYGSYRASCSCGATGLLNDKHGDYDGWRSDHTGTDPHHTEIEKAAPFSFSDTWEWDLRDYDWWFLWACQAIVWGIGQYDAAKTAAPAPEAVAS